MSAMSARTHLVQGIPKSVLVRGGDDADDNDRAVCAFCVGGDLGKGRRASVDRGAYVDMRRVHDGGGHCRALCDGRCG